MKKSKKEYYDLYWFIEDYGVYVLFARHVTGHDSIRLAWVHCIYCWIAYLFRFKTIKTAKNLEEFGLDEVSMRCCIERSVNDEM